MLDLMSINENSTEKFCIFKIEYILTLKKGQVQCIQLQENWSKQFYNSMPMALEKFMVHNAQSLFYLSLLKA